jgi:hypothetical protein
MNYSVSVHAGRSGSWGLYAIIRVVNQGEGRIMAMLAVLGGLVAGALLLAGLRSVMSEKKTRHDVVSLH